MSKILQESKFKTKTLKDKIREFLMIICLLQILLILSTTSKNTVTAAPHGLQLTLGKSSTFFYNTSNDVNNAFILIEQVCYDNKNNIISTNSLS